jgi:hypothetical protein
MLAETPLQDRVFPMKVYKLGQMFDNQKLIDSAEDRLFQLR